MLEKELKYYNDNKAELIKKYEGQFIVIVDEKVIGGYVSEIDAYSDAIAKGYELGNFLIMKCTNIEEQPQVFHSRVAFY